MTQPTKVSTTADIGTLLQNIWGKRDSGGIIAPELLLDLPLTAEQIQYLLNFYPFLQMVNSGAEFFEEIVPQFVRAKSSGWMIHDYGDAMSSSPGELLYSAGEFRIIPNIVPPTNNVKKEKKDDDKGGEGGSGTGDFVPGNGTIIKQAFMTGEEMVALALKKNWPGINIVAGTPVMQWAAWMAASDHNLPVIGYTPDESAQNKRNRVKLLAGKPLTKAPKLNVNDDE